MRRSAARRIAPGVQSGLRSSSAPRRVPARRHHRPGDGLVPAAALRDRAVGGRHRCGRAAPSISPGVMRRCRGGARLGRAAGGSAILAARRAFRRDVVRLTGSTTRWRRRWRGCRKRLRRGRDARSRSAPADLAPLQAGVAALRAADPELGPLAATADRDERGAGDADGAGAGLRGLPAGGGDSARRRHGPAGAVVAAVPTPRILGDPDFARWLAERQVVRVTRLLGTVPAVVALLEEYRASAPRRRCADPVADGCPAAADDMPTYYGLDPPTSRRSPRARGSRRRWRRSRPSGSRTGATWSTRSTRCSAWARRTAGRSLVDAAVTRHAPERGLQPRRRSKLQDLALRPQLGELMPAVAPLQELESDDRDALTAGLVAAVRDTVGKTLGVAAGAAADAAAAAAEDVSPSPDTPAPGIPPAEPRPIGRRSSRSPTRRCCCCKPDVARPGLSCRDQRLALPSGRDARAGAVRHDRGARGRWWPGRSEDLARAGLAEILPNVRPHWRLTEPVTSEIAAVPPSRRSGRTCWRALAGSPASPIPTAAVRPGARDPRGPIDRRHVRAPFSTSRASGSTNPYARRALSRSPPTAAATSSGGRTRWSMASIRFGATALPVPRRPRGSTSGWWGGSRSTGC